MKYRLVLQKEKNGKKFVNWNGIYKNKSLKSLKKKIEDGKWSRANNKWLDKALYY